MRPPDFPEDEIHRLEALHDLGLLDSDNEPDFDAVVNLGRALFDVPICLISLVDADRQWFKAKAGLDACETPREISFCGHTILGRDAMVILNALEDERFADNPLVVGPPDIRFYAGQPIRLPSGYSIGTICLISPEPRTDFTLVERQRLADLTTLALDAISVRALRADLDRERLRADHREMVLDRVDQPVALTDTEGRIERANAAFESISVVDFVDGASLDEALGLDPSRWAPEALADREVEEETVDLGDGRGRVTVHADVEGYVVIARSADASSTD